MLPWINCWSQVGVPKPEKICHHEVYVDHMELFEPSTHSELIQLINV